MCRIKVCFTLLPSTKFILFAASPTAASPTAASPTAASPTSASPTSASPTESDEGLTSSEWAAVSIALVIASLVLLVVIAGIFKWYYQRRHSRRYQFQVSSSLLFVVWTYRQTDRLFYSTFDCTCNKHEIYNRTGQDRTGEERRGEERRGEERDRQTVVFLGQRACRGRSSSTLHIFISEYSNVRDSFQKSSVPWRLLIAVGF